MDITPELRGKILVFQKNEITEHHVYLKLARVLKQPENKHILDNIANDELRHYKFWRQYTHKEVKPDKLKILKYCLISRIFGFTFGIKLMERGEEDAQESYEQLREVIPEVQSILLEENQHEATLLQLLDEEMLRYTGSIVLGLNDALVELTGSLAGLTLALRDTKLIALTGSIIGIAAALSMSASEYLSIKAEENFKSPAKASLYTGGAYIFTVLLLILPYLVFRNYFLCLICTMALAVLIISLFNYYISVVRDEPFRKRFFEMICISLGVAAFSFFIGFLMRNFLGIEI
jgi:VIT1/CCC1 family predicted Fe2+/Mn2+ transporter